MTPGISKRKSVALRIVFGAIAVAVLLGVLWLDWHWERPDSKVIGLPVGLLAAVMALIAFIEMVRPFGIIELARTGRIAMVRSNQADEE